MYTFLSIVYVLVCLFLIFVVLLQPGRGGGMGSSFGGGSSNTVFGASGAGNFLTRLTTASAALFMILSVVLAYMSSGSDKSLETASLAAKAKQEAKAKADAKKGKDAPKEAAPGTTPDIKVEGLTPGSEPIKLEQIDPSLLPGAQEQVPTLEGPKAVPVEAPKPVPVRPVEAPKPAPVQRKRAPTVEGKPEAAPSEAPAAPAVEAPAPAAPAPEAPPAP